jgi:D-Tyr-tRNAtyr deacylase
LQEAFKRAGITVTVENKREIDKAIHAMVGIKYKDCSATWREVKKRITQDDEAFISALRKAVAENA